MSAYTTSWNLPFDYDSDEPEVLLEFDAEPAERATRDYPGSPPTVEITAVIRDGWKRLDFELLPEFVREAIVQAAWEYLENLERR